MSMVIELAIFLSSIAAAALLIMLATTTTKPPTLPAAIRCTILQQVLLFAWGSLADPTLSQITLHAMAAYWTWFFLFTFRRRKTLTVSMILTVKWGYLGTLCISFVESQLIWTFKRWL